MYNGKARSQIRKSLRDHEKDEFEKLGRKFQKILLDINKRATKKILSMLVNFFNYNSYRSFYIALGRGEINSSLIMEIFLLLKKKDSNNIKKQKIACHNWLNQRTSNELC